MGEGLRGPFVVRDREVEIECWELQAARSRISRELFWEKRETRHVLEHGIYLLLIGPCRLGFRCCWMAARYE